MTTPGPEAHRRVALRLNPILTGLSRWAGFALLSLSLPQLQAHQDSVGYWSIQVEPLQVRSTIRISILDLNFLPELDANSDGVLEYPEVSARREEIQSRLLEHFLIRSGDRTLETRVEKFRILDSGELELSLLHLFHQPPGVLQLESTFHKLTDDRHRTFCQVDMDGALTQYVLDASRPVERIEVLTGWSGLARRASRFLVLGVEHILTGYDHLAFLLGLIILGGALRSLIGVVSSFTVAHSLTLILATLDLVILPTRFVEAAIALSICYVALENMFVREVRYRWVITFFFGLIHGFGFSNVLREMQLPRSGLAVSLLSFNLGVELGQLAILLLLFPAVLYLSRRRWHSVAINLASALMLGLGGFWFVQRVT